MNKLYFIPLLITFLACDNGTQNKQDGIWLGGQIVNPKENYVRLYKGEKFIDSIPLDENNFFIYKNDTLPEGLYTFTHNEFQIFYLKPGDSLMLRVNTMEFDESLTYTGIGAERNNFLMEMFLINEEENKLIPKYYPLPPKEFSRKLDSLKKIRKIIYTLYKQNNPFDSNFDRIAQASINYDYYSKKELYTSVNRSRKIDYPNGFYSYRDSIDLKSEELQWYFSYYRLLNRYFDNLVLKDNKNTRFGTMRNSYRQISNKIRIIDSLIQNEDLRNNMIYSNTKRFFESCNSSKNREKLLTLFLQTNTNPSYKKEISELSSTFEKLVPGNMIPNVFLTTTDQTYIDLYSTLKKPTVLYFWSAIAHNHNKEIHRKALLLSKKYPQYDFVGINIDKDFPTWKNLITNQHLNPLTEYQFKDNKEATKKLIISSLNKTYVLSKKGIILENNANLFSPTFEKKLTKHLRHH